MMWSTDKVRSLRLLSEDRSFRVFIYEWRKLRFLRRRLIRKRKNWECNCGQKASRLDCLVRC